MYIKYAFALEYLIPFQIEAFMVGLVFSKLAKHKQR